MITLLITLMVIAATIWWLVLPWMSKEKDKLYRASDRRMDGIWYGVQPSILEDAELQIGDVFFCAPHIKKGGLIQRSTAGIYTHCAIYIGNAQVADSTPRRGVYISSLSKFEKDYRYIAVTRCPGVWATTNDSESRKRDIKTRKKAINRYVQICKNKAVCYNPLGALLVPFREWLWIKQQSWERNSRLDWLLFLIPKRGGSGAMFCSEFIHRCFIACGYIDKTQEFSHVLSPNALAEDKIFDFVGYRSSRRLDSVEEYDPFLGGCS